MMKKRLLAISICCSLLCVGVLFAESAYARQTPPPLPMKPQQTPIDGGLGILAAAGGAYAVKKLRDKKK